MARASLCGSCRVRSRPARRRRGRGRRRGSASQASSSEASAGRVTPGGGDVGGEVLVDQDVAERPEAIERSCTARPAGQRRDRSRRARRPGRRSRPSRLAGWPRCTRRACERVPSTGPGPGPAPGGWAGCWCRAAGPQDDQVGLQQGAQHRRVSGRIGRIEADAGDAARCAGGAGGDRNLALAADGGAVGQLGAQGDVLQGRGQDAPAGGQDVRTPRPPARSFR